MEDRWNGRMMVFSHILLPTRCYLHPSWCSIPCCCAFPTPHFTTHTHTCPTHYFPTDIYTPPHPPTVHCCTFFPCWPPTFHAPPAAANRTAAPRRACRAPPRSPAAYPRCLLPRLSTHGFCCLLHARTLLPPAAMLGWFALFLSLALPSCSGVS